MINKEFLNKKVAKYKGIPYQGRIIPHYPGGSGNEIIKELLLSCWSAIESFWYINPWTEYLRSKKVLVIHPFEKSIRYQYENHRGDLFSNPKVLPSFHSLQIIKPTQGMGMSETDGYSTWFDAYEAICKKIEQTDFDIALIGAGAYGFPLAAYCKGLGKQAVHMGGCLQLLFGISGSRWELPHFGYQYKVFNTLWKRPYPEETPKNPNSEHTFAPYF